MTEMFVIFQYKIIRLEKMAFYVLFTVVRFLSATLLMVLDTFSYTFASRIMFTSFFAPQAMAANKKQRCNDL